MVHVASVEDTLQVTCSRGVKIVADKLILECYGENWDLIALPVRSLAFQTKVQRLLCLQALVVCVWCGSRALTSWL